MGENYTICDMYLFTICQWLEGDGVDINRLSQSGQSFFSVMNEDAVVKRVKAKELA